MEKIAYSITLSLTQLIRYAGNRRACASELSFFHILGHRIGPSYNSAKLHENNLSLGLFYCIKIGNHGCYSVCVSEGAKNVR